MVAIIETGGKQYCVIPNQRIIVGQLSQLVGEVISLPNLLGGEPITVEVIEHNRAPKITIRKFRNKTRYHRVQGHRQSQTVLMIKSQASDQPKATKTKFASKQKAA